MDTTLKRHKEMGLANFQNEVLRLEQEENYYEALNLCLRSARKLELLISDSVELTPLETLEVRYSYDIAMARSKFLLQYISLRADHAFSAPKMSSMPSLLSIQDEMSLQQDREECYVRNQRQSSIYEEIGKVGKTDMIIGSTISLSGQSKVDLAMPYRESKLSAEDKEHALLKAKVLQSVSIETPDVEWDSVIGIEEAKQALLEAVLVPVCYPESPQAKNAWNGILLFGPSGVGKTHIIKAVAAQGGIHFINVKVDSIMSKWQGESERNLQCLFEIARENSPSIIFFDEVEGFCRQRTEGEGDSSGRIKVKLLTEMDGIDTHCSGSTNDVPRVIVIGNTNIPSALDYAFLRRFQKRIYVPLPKRTDRKLLLKQNVNQYTHCISDDDIAEISGRTDGFSGSDIKDLVYAAGLVQLRGKLKARKNRAAVDSLNSDVALRPVTKEDFNQALKKTAPTNDKTDVNKLEAWNEKFGDGKTQYDDLIYAREKAKKHPLHVKVIAGTMAFCSII